MLRAGRRGGAALEHPIGRLIMGASRGPGLTAAARLRQAAGRACASGSTGTPSSSVDRRCDREGSACADVAGAIEEAQAACGRTVIAVGWDGRGPSSAGGGPAQADVGRGGRALPQLGSSRCRRPGTPGARRGRGGGGRDRGGDVGEVLPAERSRRPAPCRPRAPRGDGRRRGQRRGRAAQADLGIAMGSGTDVAIEASDLTLVRADLGAAVDAVRLARRTLRPSGPTCSGPSPTTWPPCRCRRGLLNPMLAGAAMAFCRVVVLNSLRSAVSAPSDHRPGGQA